MATYRNDKLRGELTDLHPRSVDGSLVLVINGIGYLPGEVLPGDPNDEFFPDLLEPVRQHVCLAFPLPDRPDEIQKFLSLPLSCDKAP